MGKCKANAIQTNLGTFGYNQTYPGIIQAYLVLCLAVTYLKLLFKHITDQKHSRTPTYSQPCYIQNAGIFQI